MIEAKLNQNVLTIKGCLPHYRRPLAEIVLLRRHIREALEERGVTLPITGNVRLSVVARRHCDGGDLANVVQAVCQALDGSTLDKTNAPLADDGQIISIRAYWIP